MYFGTFIGRWCSLWFRWYLNYALSGFWIQAWFHSDEYKKFKNSKCGFSLDDTPIYPVDKILITYLGLSDGARRSENLKWIDPKSEQRAQQEFAPASTFILLPTDNVFTHILTKPSSFIPAIYWICIWRGFLPRHLGSVFELQYCLSLLSDKELLVYVIKRIRRYFPVNKLFSF